MFCVLYVDGGRLLTLLHDEYGVCMCVCVRVCVRACVRVCVKWHYYGSGRTWKTAPTVSI